MRACHEQLKLRISTLYHTSSQLHSQRLETTPPKKSFGQCQRNLGLRHRDLASRSSRLSAAEEVFELAGVVEIGRDILGLGTGVGILAALAWSGLPVISASDKSKSRRSVDDEDAVGVKWGVMTVLSFLPLFNWLVCNSHYACSLLYLTQTLLPSIFSSVNE